MVDALVALLDATEEALNSVGIRPVVLLEVQAVVHAVHGDKADEVVVRLVFVRDEERFRIDTLGDSCPGVLSVLIHDHSRQRPVRGVLVRLFELLQ
ncbi:hypothetical protein P6U16_22295 (plasmid) [Rhizobium sp. 32-5/1]|uniref:hypothetical protein n=1 Tax=Rhizobium sp. 32-5/1 TaxID=3019602 RepID=UPI00240E951D|nr:hypothetical protein [Rhizobium sp. 32-5/1]WEZ85770.1 hypothetical protein P6U16_22295 [Rhizobium sp. 32-5/1]